MRVLRRVVRGTRIIAAALDDLLFPPHCLLTGEPITGPEPLPMISQAGLDAVDPAPFPLDLLLTAQRHHEGDELWLTRIAALWSVGSERGIDAAIHAIKYRGHQRLAVALGERLVDLLDPLPDLIVPVPIHRARRRERGYNQAELLAQGLSRVTGIPWKPAVLRTVNTPSQTSLSDAGRRSNVHAAFTAHPDMDVRGLKLVVLDDIFTTGATMNACAEVLIDAGARRVDGIAVGATV